RWRIYVFADEAAPADASRVRELADWLVADPASPLARYRPDGADIDAWFDVKVIYQQPHTAVDITDVPETFLPRVGPFQARDYERIYAARPGEDIFDGRGVSRDGAVVIVRPHHYISQVLPLDATADIAEHFDRIMG